MTKNPYQSPQVESEHKARPRLSAAQGAFRGAKLGALWVGGVIAVISLLVVVGLASYGLYKLGNPREVWNRMFSFRILQMLILAPVVSGFVGAIVCATVMGIGTATENRLKK
jgi:ABC-type molybdate transport system permease subunit